MCFGDVLEKVSLSKKGVYFKKRHFRGFYSSSLRGLFWIDRSPTQLQKSKKIPKTKIPILQQKIR